MESTNISIKNWAEDDKPREKLMLKGKASLSDAELLAILIGSGNRNESAVALSQRILMSAQNSLVELGKMSLEQLLKFKGIGEAKAITILAATELARRRKSEDAVIKQQIRSSEDTFQIMQPLIGELAHEEFWIICLSNFNKVLHKAQVSVGGRTGTIADTRMVFKVALEHNATAIVVVHNHPSGNTKPSILDYEVTKKLILAGQQIEIKVIDHVIVAEHSYYSFHDKNQMTAAAIEQLLEQQKNKSEQK